MNIADQHRQRRADFREVMQVASAEFELIDPEYIAPERAVSTGSFSSLNLRSEIDVKCANLAEWMTAKTVDWIWINGLKADKEFDKQTISGLLSPGILAIGETHAAIPLLGEDMDLADIEQVANRSTDFTRQYAYDGTAVFYAVRRWAGLRKTYSNAFEYDPEKLELEGYTLGFVRNQDHPVTVAKNVAKKLDRPALACVALQAIVTGEDNKTLYDAMAGAYTKAATRLIYAGMSLDQITDAREYSSRIRKNDLNGTTITEQMQAALAEIKH